MTYVSLPKKLGNPGAPVAKDPNVILIPVSMIESAPDIPENSALVTEPITLKVGAKAPSIYLTPETIKIEEKTEGDNDRRGFVNSIEGSHPGSEPEFRTFKKSAINDDFVVLLKNENGVQMIGTPLNPMKLSTEGQDDKDANQTTLKLSQSMRGKNPILDYTGTLPAIADIATPPVPDSNPEQGA